MCVWLHTTHQSSKCTFCASLICHMTYDSVFLWWSSTVALLFFSLTVGDYELHCVNKSFKALNTFWWTCVNIHITLKSAHAFPLYSKAAANKWALIFNYPPRCAVKPSIIRRASHFLTNMHLEVNKKLFILSEACHQRTAAWLQTITPSWRRKKPHQRDRVILTSKGRSRTVSLKEIACQQDMGQDQSPDRNF